MIQVTFKDGSSREFEKGISALDVAKSLSAGLARQALSVEIDGETRDLTTPLEQDCKVTFLTFADDMGRWTMRHTASHVLAQAMKKLHPEAKLAIGPAIDNGFYYDFDLDGTLSTDDLTASSRI